MCGITGILNLDQKSIDKDLLQKMTDSLAHRGPDGEGLYVDRFLGLGHRRLAIIDLSEAGRQPMSTKDDRYILTYNGEIYNFKELKSELENSGHIFYSKTDSEVVLRAYIAWGERCLDRFNGMFAFAIWDKVKQELFMARDRYGIKPLYYSFQGNSFLFGSEHKAIVINPGFKKDLNHGALLQYFTFQNIFTTSTLFQGIELFPAGCWTKLSVGLPTRELRFIRYWDFHFEEPKKILPEQDYIEELDRLLRQAVHRQLVSDVPLGSYLSGGIDSGSITSMAARELPYIRTFTCGFDLHSVSGLEIGFDERDKAELMSYLFKTEHYEMVLKAGDMERVMSKLVWHLEEPRVGQSYPNYYVAQLASKFVKVVLSGTGGDELFGGYPWRYYRAVRSNNFDHYINQYYAFWQRLINEKDVPSFFKPIWNEVKNIDTKEIFKNVFGKQENNIRTPADYVNHSLYFEAKTFLHGLLVVEDKLSMAHGLETRVPFLDNDLVDFAMRIPLKLKLQNVKKVMRANENETKRYHINTRDGKILLRKLIKRYLPSQIAKGPKKGFSAPDASWFKGESIDYIKKKLLADNLLIYNYIDKNTTHRLIIEHLQGKENRRLYIWSLLNFEWWLTLYGK